MKILTAVLITLSLLLQAVLAVSSACAVENAAEKSRPNIVLIMSDDQGWGQVGYMNHPHLKGKTPNLDAMAESGIRFNRFYAAASVCSPTRASVLTGRSPRRTGVPGLHKRLCLQEKTLPQALKKAGYATAHFGKWHLGGVQGSAMPILPDDPNGPKYYGFDEYLSATNYIEMNPLMTHNDEIVYLEGESSVLMVEAGLKFIEANREQPTFTVLWYGSPHFPYTASEQDMKGLPEGLDKKVRHLLGEIIAMDRSIGMLRARLRELDLAKNTLIWFCSDNGGREHDPHSQSGLRGYKGSLYEGGIRVPGLIEWQGKIQPKVTDFPASTMDIMPTLIDLLDLPKDLMLDVVDGESIVPLFTGNTPKRTHPIYFGNKGTAVIDGRYKCVKNGNGAGTPWQLFDLNLDPGETNDLAAQQPDRLERMKAEALAIQTSIDASEQGKDYPEGKVLQPQRSEPWFEMEAYQSLYDRFAELKPGWTPPRKKSNEKNKERQ
ncbi:Arylsulfatase precursor [Thalassoglobus neptunius]|uniref:Arylsulfatase n=1 Tax=Thalassoglobus neptunius TaxID=1938619 RepID=A0A5C5VUX0_9PLAN|nr:sulfatase-like hydrolase/transferase [Thalassoglobus neptunius]TWT42436.1 Arylsulfatase precursor [Thalassoglobus neptunius]